MCKQVTSVPILGCHSSITSATNCSLLLLKLSILFLQAKIVPHLTLASRLLVQLLYSRRRVCRTYFLQENKITAARLLRAHRFPRIMRAQVSFGGFSRFSIFQYCQPTRYRQTVNYRYRDHDYIPVYRPTLNETSNSYRLNTLPLTHIANETKVNQIVGRQDGCDHVHTNILTKRGHITILSCQNIVIQYTPISPNLSLISESCLILLQLSHWQCE